MADTASAVAAREVIVFMFVFALLLFDEMRPFARLSFCRPGSRARPRRERARGLLSHQIAQRIGSGKRLGTGVVFSAKRAGVSRRSNGDE
jgi:hypothetical protein